MQKPGWKTSEFWLSLAAAVLGAFVASGVLPSENLMMKIAGMALAALASLGYAASRGRAKNGNGNGGNGGNGGWARLWLLAAITVVTFVVLGALSGCAGQQTQQGFAYAKAAERTACLVGLVVCQQLPEERRTACLSAQKDICAVTPQLLAVWEAAVSAKSPTPAAPAAGGQ